MSITTPPWPTSNSRPLKRPSPTGSCVAASNACKGAPVSNTYTVVNPATEQAVADVQMADLAAVDAVIDRAAAALPAWRA
ncbi:MAG: aldehyde dehydrogenase family protein, partial [Tetrasphaera sp.]|nr:aldehyde dehydrogenase family protein [Tetrasphaera sp.]